MITTEMVKKLRDRTGVSVIQCKRSLEEADGDMDKAMTILQKKSKEISTKKGDRTLGAGIVEAYIHSTGTVGAMVELLCETDFVAKNEDFRKLARDIAMQATAMNPDGEEVLLNQPFIKNPELTMQNLIQSAVQKFGERIEISRFVRYSVSE